MKTGGLETPERAKNQADFQLFSKYHEAAAGAKRLGSPKKGHPAKYHEEPGQAAGTPGRRRGAGQSENTTRQKNTANSQKTDGRPQESALVVGKRRKNRKKRRPEMPSSGKSRENKGSIEENTAVKDRQGSFSGLAAECREYGGDKKQVTGEQQGRRRHGPGVFAKRIGFFQGGVAQNYQYNGRQPKRAAFYPPPPRVFRCGGRL